MHLKSGVLLFIKGFSMGTVDIVPGVSGSTVAVLLGIYERFIGALKNIDGKLFAAFFRMFREKFSEESRKKWGEAFRQADMPWLLVLFCGIASAFVIASFVIPALMARFPQIMRGIFFGLVLGSIVTPIRQTGGYTIGCWISSIVFATVFFFLLQQRFTPPIEMIQIMTDSPQTITELCTKTACALPPGDIAGLPENAALAASIPLAEGSQIPAGTSVFLPILPWYFCLAAGFIAICAMLLPGISGSFVLLVLGCYFFMLNTGKSFIHALGHGDFLWGHLGYVGCFALGAVLGVAAFSRVLNWLLKKHHRITLAAIVGILLGCLPAVWPFNHQNAKGETVNFFPNLDTELLWPTVIAILVGLGIVVCIVWLGLKPARRIGQKPDSRSP